MNRAMASIPVTEKDFQAQILELAGLLGWRAYFTWKSLHSPAGFPDLVLCRPPRLVFAELKRSPKQRPTADQEAWLEALGGCGLQVYVWRPGELEQIAKVLR